MFSRTYSSVSGAFQPAEGLMQFGPVVDVVLSIDPEHDLRQPIEGNRARPSRSMTGLGVIDTGAEVTAVDVSVEKALGLRYIGKGPVQRTTSTGTVYGAERYVAEITIVNSGFPPFLSKNIYLMGDLRSSYPPGVNVLCLLGRDFLKEYVLTYDGPGGTINLVRPNL